MDESSSAGPGSLARKRSFPQSPSNDFVMARTGEGHSRTASGGPPSGGPGGGASSGAGGGGGGGGGGGSSTTEGEWKVLLSDKLLHFVHQVQDNALKWNRARLEVSWTSCVWIICGSVFLFGRACQWL